MRTPSSQPARSAPDLADRSEDEVVEEITSFDEMMGKHERVAKVPVVFPSKGGTEKSVKKLVLMKAISAVDYDELVAECAPNRQQRDQGMQYDPEKFQPALVAACSVQPALTRDQASQLYKNPRWAGGEFGTLFLAAQRLCNVTMDVPFSVTG
jgi:hypothetical protein